MPAHPFASVLGDFLVGSVIVLFYLGVILVWAFSLYDLFARIDLAGWQKALWLLAVFVVPLFGVIAYWVLRPRTARWRGSDIFDESIDPMADTRTGELERLAALHEQGKITDAEFEGVKQRLLAA